MSVVPRTSTHCEFQISGSTLKQQNKEFRQEKAQPNSWKWKTQREPFQFIRKRKKAFLFLVLQYIMCNTGSVHPKTMVRFSWLTNTTHFKNSSPHFTKTVQSVLMNTQHWLLTTRRSRKRLLGRHRLWEERKILRRPSEPLTYKDWAGSYLSGYICFIAAGNTYITHKKWIFAGLQRATP